jgi:outer membrane murein-binding lipoprotein Lpp
MDETEPTVPTTDAFVARIAALEAALAAERAAHATSQAKVEKLTKGCDHLRASHERLRQDLELLRRRIFIAKAERVDSSQLEMEFAKKLAALDELAGKLVEASESGDLRTLYTLPPATGEAAWLARLGRSALAAGGPGRRHLRNRGPAFGSHPESNSLPVQ